MRPNLAFGPIDSLTQYLLYLSVVAMGIFVPLAIQKVIRRRTEKAMVAFATSNIATELSDNLGALSRAQTSFEGLRTRLSDELSWYESIWKNIRAGEVPMESPPREITPISYSLASTTAWEMARLSGTLPLLQPKQLLRFSSAYRALDLYNHRRELFIQHNISSAAIDAPFDASNISAIDRRLEVLLVQMASAKYQAGVCEGAITAVRAAIDT